MISINLFSSKVNKKSEKRVNLGGRRIQCTIIHCASKMLTAIAATNSAVTDVTPHLVLVARVVAAGVDNWDFEGRHDAQIVEVVDVKLGLEAEDIRFGEVHPPKLDSFYRSPTSPLTPSAFIKLQHFIPIFTPICLRPSLSVHQDDGSKASTLCPWLLVFLIIILLDICWLHLILSILIIIPLV